MPDDPFESPRLLIEGARNDIQNLDLEARAFLNGCFAVPSVKRDRKTGENVLKYRIPQKIPGRLRVLASNAVNNLRHALDHAVNCAAVELGGKRNNYFPFGKDEPDFDRVVKTNCKTVPPSLCPTLKGFEPYGGGDDVLYTLSRLAAPNKHQVLLNMNLDFPHVIVNHLIAEAHAPFRLQVVDWDSRKQEFEYARIGPGGAVKFYEKAKLPLVISVGDSKISSSEPAPAFLDTLAGKVEDIVSAIEAETERLR